MYHELVDIVLQQFFNGNTVVFIQIRKGSFFDFVDFARQFIRLFIIRFRCIIAAFHVKHFLCELSGLPVLVFLGIFFQQFPILPPHRETECGTLHFVTAHHVRLLVFRKRLAFLTDMPCVSFARKALVGLAAAAYFTIVSVMSFLFLCHFHDIETPMQNRPQIAWEIRSCTVLQFLLIGYAAVSGQSTSAGCAWAAWLIVLLPFSCRAGKSIPLPLWKTGT